MEETLIGFETAKLANNKGFNVECDYFYNKGSNYKLQNDSIIRTGDDLIYEAPTQSLLQKWLREKHELSLEIFSLSYHNKIQFTFNLKKLNKYEIAILSKDNLHYNSHEEALGAGLIESLKLI